jgi:hypothetical protein
MVIKRFELRTLLLRENKNRPLLGFGGNAAYPWRIRGVEMGYGSSPLCRIKTPNIDCNACKVAPIKVEGPHPSKAIY